MRELFELRGTLPRGKKIAIEIIGGMLLFLCWLAISELGLVRTGILPSPLKVIAVFQELLVKDRLLHHAGYSILLNLLGYVEAVAIGVPLGFLIGLVPVCRALAERYITSQRYLPLTALIGLFMLAFGIATNMKVQFLAYGIMVYLVPQVVQRIDEVEEVYLHTIKTLGATKWQTIRHVFIPAVISRVFSDIVVLIGISWTYIIFAEVVNTSDGGLGALAFIASRQSQTPKLFAVLFVIALIGFFADKIGKALDRWLFRYKYV